MKEKDLVEEQGMLSKYKHKAYEGPNEGHQLFMAFPT